jgi:hypothetical protein
VPVRPGLRLQRGSRLPEVIRDAGDAIHALPGSSTSPVAARAASLSLASPAHGQWQALRLRLISQ